MSPDFLTSLVSSLPNLAVAIWCIWNYQKTIEKLIDQENKLLDQLLVRVNSDDKATQNLRPMSGPKP